MNHPHVEIHTRWKFSLGSFVIIMWLVPELIHFDLFCQPYSLAGGRAGADFALPSAFLYLDEKDLCARVRLCEWCVTAGLFMSACVLTCPDRSINEKEMQSAVGSLPCCAKREQVRVFSSYSSCCTGCLCWLLSDFLVYLLVSCFFFFFLLVPIAKLTLEV